MSGVWETLFYEEKQDWISFIVNGVSGLLAFAVELPCMLLAFVSTSLILATDYTCQGANIVSDYLGLKEWWALEHTIWSVMLIQAMAVSYNMSKKNCHGFMLRMFYNLQCMFAWGCFLFMLNGLQGGVVFGGKFYHPSLAFLAVTAQILKLVYRQVRYESDGFEHDAKASSERVSTCLDIFDKVLGYYATLFLFVATFGIPKFDLEADPTPWLAAVPMLGFLYYGPGFMAELSGGKAAAVDANGAASPVEEKPAEPAKAAEPTKAAEEPTKASEEKKDGEKTEEAATTEVAKVNPLCAVMECCSGMCSKAVACVTCVADKACCCVNFVKAKVCGLPWPAIISLITTLGSAFGMTLAYWSLTEDKLVFVAPAVALLGPHVLAQMESRNWLDAKGVHFGSSLMKTVACGVQYYIFRTYISQPI